MTDDRVSTVYSSVFVLITEQKSGQPSCFLPVFPFRSRGICLLCFASEGNSPGSLLSICLGGYLYCSVLFFLVLVQFSGVGASLLCWQIC
jgi:hypothetical protein